MATTRSSPKVARNCAVRSAAQRGAARQQHTAYSQEHSRSDDVHTTCTREEEGPGAWPYLPSRVRCDTANPALVVLQHSTRVSDKGAARRRCWSKPHLGCVPHQHGAVDTT
jgi:hypothetical protein